MLRALALLLTTAVNLAGALRITIITVRFFEILVRWSRQLELA